MLRRVDFIGNGYECVRFVMVDTDTMAEAIEAAKNWYKESGQDFQYIGMEIPKEYAFNPSYTQEVVAPNSKVFESVAKQLEHAVALEYKGILFDDWTVDEENQSVWAEMCQDCADKHMDVLSAELTDDGACGACSVKGCDVVGADSENERHYYVDFHLDLIHPLDRQQLREQYPEVVNLGDKLFDAKSRLNDEEAAFGLGHFDQEMEY